MSDHRLHDYQELGVEFLRNRPRSALMMDMGLGKTATVLSALEDRHLPALVLAPKRVAENVWDVEQGKWRPDLTTTVAMGGPQERHRLLRTDADITVLSRDNQADLDDLKKRDRTPFKTLVIDELSGYKNGGNRGSIRWKTARRMAVRDTTQHVWGLTGTPAPNGYLDLWGQIALLDGGERLGRALGHYRSRYFYPGNVLPSGVVTEWLLREGADDRIKEKIQDICLAMEAKGRINLPPTTFNDVATDLPTKARKAYDDLKNDLVVDLRDIFDGHLHTAGTAAVLTSRLSQIAAGFLYVDDAALHDNDRTILHYEKMDALQEIVESPHEGGVLVGYRFTAERDMIRERFDGKKNRPLARFVDEPGVFKDWDAGEVEMLVAHPASVGHGLNLQYGGHTIVWTQPIWDLELWDQFNKRLARQGQPHPVVIHVLMAKQTVDRKVRLRLDGKSDTQQDLLAFLESPI